MISRRSFIAKSTMVVAASSIVPKAFSSTVTQSNQLPVVIST